MRQQRQQCAKALKTKSAELGLNQLLSRSESSARQRRDISTRQLILLARKFVYF